IHSHLKDSATQMTSPARERRLRQALVGAETSLAVALLVGALVMVRGFQDLQQTDPGFASDHLLTLRMQLPPARYRPNARIQFFQEAVSHAARIPGVRSAGVVSFLPFSGSTARGPMTIEGEPAPPRGAPN